MSRGPRANNNRFEIDLKAIAGNVATVRRSVGSRVWLCVALKADAYGFGLLPVAKTALLAGADALAVGHVADGVQLRSKRIKAPILVYGGEPLSPSLVRDLEDQDLIATVHDDESLRACLRSARHAIEVMVEVDVGLGRLGFHPTELVGAVARIRSAARLRLRGVYTHMRVEARPDARATQAQFAAFQAAARDAGPGELKMAASSRVLDRTAGMTLNAVDVGRAVYGLLPRSGGRLGPRLKPAFARLSSTLTTVKAIPSQSRTGALHGVRRLGVIPFGRAAGMAAISTGTVLVGGRRTRVIGTPSLEHARIDLTRLGTATVGDEVVIVGHQGGAEIRMADVLRRHPELPDAALGLHVGASVERVYLA